MPSIFIRPRLQCHGHYRGFGTIYTLTICMFSVFHDEYMQDGCTPLHCAATTNAVETAALLIEQGADINTADKVDGSF
jgi:hypothetical protein